MDLLSPQYSGSSGSRNLLTANNSFPSPQDMQQKQQQGFGGIVNKTLNVGKAVGNALTSSEQTFGKGLSTVGSKIPGQQTDQAAQNTQNVTKLLQIYHNSTDPVQKQHLADVLKSMGTDVTATDINSGFGLSNKQVVGAAAGTALDFATAGSLKGANPAGEVNALKKIGQTGIKTAATGAGYGISQGLQDNKSVGDIAKQAATSAAISGGIGIGVQGLAEFGKVLTSQKLGENIVDKSLGTPKNVIQAGRSPAKQIVSEGLVNSKRGFLNNAEMTIKESDNAIKKELAQNNVL